MGRRLSLTKESAVLKSVCIKTRFEIRGFSTCTFLPFRSDKVFRSGKKCSTSNFSNSDFTFFSELFLVLAAYQEVFDELLISMLLMGTLRVATGI